MGSGASHLNSEQKSLLVQKITSAYEKCSANKLDDEIVIQVLMSDYRRVLTDITPTKAAIIYSPPFTTGSSKIIGKTTKFGVGLKDVTKNTTIKPTRRRSFDSSRITMIKGKNTKMKSSQSETAVKLAETALDSWDSVTQQPFCEICQMAFKTTAFLERHIKYSDLHTKNVEKRKTPTKMNVPLVTPKTPSTDEEEVTSPGLVEPQVEGKQYRLLYTGSKIFWRTQRTIDIDIYVHIYPEILEVIAFDPVKYKEITRMYLDYAAMRDMLTHLANADFDDKIKELKQDRFFALTDEDAMRDKFIVQRVNTYVLQRLQLDPGNPAGEILFMQLHGDDEVLSPLLDGPPLSMVPVAVARRRKTSAEEIDATINSLKTDRQFIGKHLDMASHFTSRLSAERISSAVHTFVKYLTSKKWYSDLPIPKQRFIRAVRRVVRMNLVKKTVEELTRRQVQAKQQQTLPSRKYIVRAREM